MKIHLIAIGGSAMHNLAIALHDMGIIVTGSDDEFFEPSRGRLLQKGLLPDAEGWDANRISEDLDAVILGMHARADNPELIKALELGIEVYSYPEYLYQHSKNKTRIVIGGSHGKTTITAMVMHVLQHQQMDFDYMVGAQLDGFETMVRLTEDAPYMIIEGDEYLASPIDRRPKFHLYNANIALLSGIAWDHINVFPTFENYLEQFKIFVENMDAGSPLVFNEKDEEVRKIAHQFAHKLHLHPYQLPDYSIENGITFIHYEDEKIPLKVFGEHNLSNLEGARIICNIIGVNNHDFYHSIALFNGAAKRLQLLGSNSHTAVYKDFAHSPSKLQATTAAVHNQFPHRQLIACMELHTFSSLNKIFLQGYFGAMKDADEAIVYYNPQTIAHKKLDPISVEEVMEAFGGDSIRVFTDSDLLEAYLRHKNWENSNLLLMSSGNFNGMNQESLVQGILSGH